MANTIITYGEMLDRIDWFDLAYPEKWCIVEVKYAGGGDIAIAEGVRTERGKVPKEIDNARGFTACFKTYKEAEKYARHIAKELKIIGGGFYY